MLAMLLSHCAKKATTGQHPLQTYPLSTCSWQCFTAMISLTVRQQRLTTVHEGIIQSHLNSNQDQCIQYKHSSKQLFNYAPGMNQWACFENLYSIHFLQCWLILLHPACHSLQHAPHAQGPVNKRWGKGMRHSRHPGPCVPRCGLPFRVKRRLNN